MVKGVENLTLELLDVFLVGRLPLLLKQQGHHLVTDRLWIFIHDHGLAFLQNFLPLLLLLVLLRLLFVLIEGSWVDQSTTLLAT